MNFRKISYRYGSFARELEAHSSGEVFWARLPHGLVRPQWRPPADLYEAPDALTLKVELAGVDEAELQVEIYEDVLVVEGARPWRKPEGVTRFLAVEIPYGPFRLEVALPPEGLDRDAVDARFEQGMLLVRVPKRAAGP